MRTGTTLLLLTILVAAPATRAQDAAPPEPATLDADWWLYLQPEKPLEGAEFARRTDDMLGQLKTLLAASDASQRIDLEPRVKTLRDLLGNYREKRSEARAPMAPLPPAPTSFTLEAALLRHQKLRGVRLELDSEQEDSRWQQELVKAERVQHSRRKVAYLGLDAAAPQRTVLGLELMASRLQLELRVLGQERRRAKIALLEGRLDALQAEVAEIPLRLTADPGEAAAWAARHRKALDAASKLREAPVADGADPSGARVAALRAIAGEAAAFEQDLLAHRAALSEMLVRLVTGQELQIQVARAALQTAEAQLKTLPAKQGYWKGVAERARSAVRAVEPGQADTLHKEALRLSDRITQTLDQLDQERDAAAFVAELLDGRLLLGETAVDRLSSQAADAVAVSWELAKDLMTASLFEVNETPVTAFGLVRVLVILTIAWLLSKGVRRALKRLASKRKGVSQDSLYTLGRVVHYFVLAVGLVVGLSSIGIDFTKFALLASALGIGIGFGMQTLVSNFVAGLIILFEKSLKVGDFVELESGITGEVREINMRSTLITTNDNVDILVPNSEFINKEVTNWTLREAQRRIRIAFGVAYGSDKQLVRKAVLEAADAVPWTLKTGSERAPQVWLVSFGDSSLDFELVVWLNPDAVKRPGSVKAAYLWEIEGKLKDYGIEIPFPQRDLHLRSGFEALAG